MADDGGELVPRRPSVLNDPTWWGWKRRWVLVTYDPAWLGDRTLRGYLAHALCWCRALQRRHGLAMTLVHETDGELQCWATKVTGRWETSGRGPEMVFAIEDVAEVLNAPAGGLHFYDDAQNAGIGLGKRTRRHLGL